ncbi:ANTAR domain-containing protein [Streptomyces sp. NPDC102365]|uniref:ANTAR domain-containing protein n=1 Tax=Streptomyces sp. NPDC102365 TaxID=3366162 RepID=UPI00382DA098
MGATTGSLLASLRPAADEGERREWAVACAHALGLGGSAVFLGRELVWFSDDTSARLEDPQFVLGQGPGPLIGDEREVRQVPDLGRLLAQQWPRFAAEAEALDIAALFVWPVHIGAVPAGTMTGYRRTPGPLTRQQPTGGRLVTDALAEQALHHWPAAHASHNGTGHTGTVELHRAEVHQATGVLSVQLDVSLAGALDRLRSEACTSGRSLTDTAGDIIQRKLPQ